MLTVAAKGRAAVYNLSVADTPEYFANGVLVHNCMYGVMAHRNQQNSVPLAYFVGHQIQEAFAGREIDITSAHLMRLQAQAKFGQTQDRPMRLGRFAGRGLLGIQ